MPDELRLTLPDIAATQALAARAAAMSLPGDAILLQGPLGAGKSEFARSFLRTATANPQLEVPSPSYTLVQTYDSPLGPIHHFDLWRLDSPAALAELGWDDATNDIVLVEWPDRLATQPENGLRIELHPQPGESRKATLTGWPGRLHRLHP